MRLRKVSHVSEADHQLVTAAVSAAESHTSGEIVTIVTDLSDHYEDVAMFWAGVAAFLALSAVALFPSFYLDLFNRLLGGWEHEYSAGEYVALIALFAGLKWLGSWLILQYIPLRLWFTPSFVSTNRVRARAVALFKVGAEARTRGRTGILIYLSMREHRAELIADEAIVAKVAPEVWGDAMLALIDNVRAGRPGEGMAEAVRQVGIVLAEHFPQGSDNPNELPDRLIEL